jgi:late competence protein required for DNA uptake (superfamily II DNA/RNA helicase)
MQVEDWKERRDILRLNERKTKLEGKRCIHCDMRLASQLSKKKRSYLYCRDCIERLSVQVRRHRWRRYYDRKREELQAKARERQRKYRASLLTESVLSVKLQSNERF